jgi:hypothetical protein
MDINVSRSPWLDEIPFEMQMIVKSIDFFYALILLGSLIGMYRGIEISHPSKIELKFYKNTLNQSKIQHFIPL